MTGIYLPQIIDVLASTLVQIMVSMNWSLTKNTSLRYINRTIEIIITLDFGTSSAKAFSFSFDADTGVWEEIQGVDNVQAAQGKHCSQRYFVCPLHMDFPDERHRQANQHYIGDNMYYRKFQDVPLEKYSVFVCGVRWKTTYQAGKYLDQNHKSANYCGDSEFPIVTSLNFDGRGLTTAIPQQVTSTQRAQMRTRSDRLLALKRRQ